MCQECLNESATPYLNAQYNVCGEQLPLIQIRSLSFTSREPTFNISTGWSAANNMKQYLGIFIAAVNTSPGI